MNNLLLLFFALPIAVIIISIALQKLFKNPLLVALIIFAIFLVATFIIGDLTYLVATIVYTILAFVTAISTKIICRILRKFENEEQDNKIGDCSNTETNNGTQVLSITGGTVSNNDNLNVYPTYDTLGRNRVGYRYYKR